VRTIGIVSALRQEGAPFIAGMDGVCGRTVGRFVIETGTIGGRCVSLVVSGVGRRPAREAAEALIEFSRPSLIVSTGFAGGLSEEAAAGVVVCGCDLVDEEGDRETFSVPDGFVLPAGGVWGVIVTSRHFVSAIDHRRELRDRFGAVAVDMESIHIGRAARAAGIPVLVTRVISDDLSAELPVMSSVTKMDGTVDVGRAIPYFIRHPGTIAAFIRFMTGLNTHADTLSDGLRRLVMSLSAG